jgi:low affinity Fe/Cu permease
MREFFRRLAVRVADALGTPWAFFAAVSLVVGWGATGPLFNFSEIWQLVINTSTTIVTFLLLFLVQATQNRNDKAIQLKLDELIRISKARNAFADLEDASEEELAEKTEEFRELRKNGDP